MTRKMKPFPILQNIPGGQTGIISLIVRALCLVSWWQIGIAQELKINTELNVVPETEKINPKIQTAITEIISAFNTEGFTGSEKLAAQRSIPLFSGNKIRVVIHLTFPEAHNLLKEIPGVTVESTYENLAQVLVPLPLLEELTEIPQVKFIREPYYPNLNTITGEGVEATNAQTFHDAGITGEGTRIAILDVGFAGYDSLLGTELPSTVTTISFRADGDITGGGQVHGTACSEIVHEMAPGAELYLVNIETDVEFPNAVDWIISQGVDIISASLGLMLDPHDGSGPLDEKVDEAREAGLLWVNAAGNQASSHYQDSFTDGDNDNWHDFITGDEVLSFYAYPGLPLLIYLMWDEWFETDEDYDLYLWDGDLNIIASSVIEQSGTQPPFEFISHAVSEEGYYGIAIYRHSATRDVKLEIFISGASGIEYITPESSVTTPATARGALAVGAADYLNYDVSAFQIEVFSSQGPTNDGRTKPDLVGPDGVSGYSYGSNAFYGTSATCPHVSGAAALVLSTEPSLTPQQLKNKLMAEHTDDVGSSGLDNISGAGLLKLKQVASTTIPSPERPRRRRNTGQ